MQDQIRLLKSARSKQSQRLDQKSKNGQEKTQRVVLTKEAKETHLLVATLIATVSFAAGITVPGGTIQDGENKGSPVLVQIIHVIKHHINGSGRYCSFYISFHASD